MVDIGSRKNKAVLSTLLYTISIATTLIHDKDVLFIGRILYGAASAYHHTSFEAYVVHEHGSLGFPDEWLSQTFSLLTHSMSLLAALLGVVGQIVSSNGGVHSVIVFTLTLFIGATIYILISWTKDVSSPKFLLGNFTSTHIQTFVAIRKNKNLAYFILISAFSETAFTVFTYYWAMLITSIASMNAYNMPYALIFSSYICTSMIGAYLHSIYSAKFGPDLFFQGVLSGLVASFSLASTVQTTLVYFISSLAIYGFIGAYWPCIGTLRAKVVGAEQRTSSLLWSRALSCLFTVLVLYKLSYSPVVVLIICAVCVAVAAFFQNQTMQMVSSLTYIIYLICNAKSEHHVLLCRMVLEPLTTRGTKRRLKLEAL